MPATVEVNAITVGLFLFSIVMPIVTLVYVIRIRNVVVRIGHELGRHTGSISESTTLKMSADRMTLSLDDPVANAIAQAPRPTHR